MKGKGNGNGSVGENLLCTVLYSKSPHRIESNSAHSAPYSTSKQGRDRESRQARQRNRRREGAVGVWVCGWGSHAPPRYMQSVRSLLVGFSWTLRNVSFIMQDVSRKCGFSAAIVLCKVCDRCW